ncbi:MAG: hypothetical protein F6K19_03000 [Cyanothece sp. SIO1E1]|nr:hypothetical protein [Cyanothece sp. SIO1E1]
MGYTTSFTGYFQLDQRLLDAQVLYLLDFARTRHCKRDVQILQDVSDPAREAVNLPLGEEGCYFANYRWDWKNEDCAVVDYNRPTVSQPSLWCQWIPTDDGGGIQWDQGEKFKQYLAWLQYLVRHFLEPWGYYLSGTVQWQGESAGDRGQIVMENNQMIAPSRQDYLEAAIAPVAVPPHILAGFEALQAQDPTLIYSWVASSRAAAELGYPATANWIETHLEDYIHAVERGFTSKASHPNP